MKNLYRTIYCGDVDSRNIGENIKLAGWVKDIRNLGSLVFMTLRDETGVVQVISEEVDKLKDITRESTITVTGVVRKRAKGMTNPNMKTGEIGVLISSFEILGAALPILPFEISRSKEAFEDTRLKYRYLDLRNPEVHERILFRSEVIDFIRKTMKEMHFTEIQTPIITASSPEGARDFIIPSRKYKGKFYALPQAPQIFKQLLMCSGFDRYFQIAPCFRDEDPRSDRLYGEFYQLDFEMAFATEEEVYDVGQKVFYDVFSRFGNKKVSSLPFRRIPYKEAMLKYGTDKPDLRNPLIIEDISEILAKSSFELFKCNLARGIYVYDINKPNSWYKSIEEYIKSIGGSGLAYIKVNSDMSFKSSIDKFLDDSLRKDLIDKCHLTPGSTLFVLADTKNKIDKLAGNLRIKLGTELELIDNSKYEFCIINDFPMFEYDDETQRYYAKHHPFTKPKDEDLDKLETDPEHCLADAYDIVLNGYELGGGSQRIYDQNVQERAFKALGFTQEQIDAQFGWFVEGLQYGTPPHGGFALGLDRIAMLLCGCDSLRDVIAFPKNTSATCPMSKAPTPVADAQLEELGIGVKEYESNKSE